MAARLALPLRFARDRGDCQTEQEKKSFIHEV
jgi:hypothetical protein